MKNIKKRISALVLTTVFASMQIASANVANFDTGLGAGNGGAVINNATSGLVDVQTGKGVADLNFNSSASVNWNTLNVNNGETLNFNAVNGANNLTILNTVNYGMSTFAGSVNANSGIGNLIISNPNGVLFDGASFSTAGDLNITTDPMRTVLKNGAMDVEKIGNGAMPVGTVEILRDSNFSVGGDFNIVAPKINVSNSTIKVGQGKALRLTTTNGQDYLSNEYTGKIEDVVADQLSDKNTNVRLEAVSVDGDVYITSNGKGAVKTVSGGKINGNLTIDSDGEVALNYEPNGKVLEVTGDVNAKANNVAMYAYNVKTGGDLNMTNGGGFVEVQNARVGGDMNLTTTGDKTNYLKKGNNKTELKHFVHVAGDVTVEGNANIQSEHNIHIGGYNYDKKQFSDGNFKVGKDLTAHAKDGHVTVTIDTEADKIDLKSDSLNILSDGKAVLKANEYKFSSNGYIGSIADYTREDGTVLTKEDQLIGIMENYIYIPNDIKSHDYINVTGADQLGAAKITAINTPGNAYIRSNGNITVTGANAQDVNITAPKSRIDITGPDVHARNINVGPETDYLKVDFEGRDFTTNFTNIRDEKVVTLKPTDVVTYENTDGYNGHNYPTLKPGEKTTYLIGPGFDPVPPPPTPDPENPTINPYDEVSRHIKQWVPDDVTAAPVNTPVAFAADLDDDEIDKAVRKNVDGSVTVVRAYAMGK